MTKPRDKESLIRYYCTAGNGMETFLIDELKRKLSSEDVCQVPGKVLFSSSAGMNRLTELKAAERLFLLVKQDSPVQLSTHTSPAKAASLLQSKLLGDRNQWSRVVMTWSRLQGELAARRTDANTTSTVPALTKGREEGRGSEDHRGKEESGVESCKSTEEGSRNEQTLGNKRKRNKEDDGVQEVGHEERRRKEEMSGKTCLEDLTLEKRRKKDDDDDEEEEDAKKDEDVGYLGEKEQMSFRISCKCTGSLSRYFSTQEVSKVIGLGLSRLLGWRVDLKNPQLEINVYLSDDHCMLGIPLTRLPLANRSYIKNTGLRSTVAWAMASLAQIQPGFCVVDPMCGVGTILIEAAQEHKGAYFLGVDIDDGQLQKANQNVEFANLENRLHLLKASSMALPLPSASVDAVVCDLPFGKKFGTKANMAANLPLILTEMERVLCVGGTLVLLLSPQLSCLLKKLLAQRETGPESNQEAKSQTTMQDCPSPSVSAIKQQTLELNGGVKPSPAQERDPLSSLKHQATLRVSLGVIDGLIHKYIKTDS